MSPAFVPALAARASLFTSRAALPQLSRRAAAFSTATMTLSVGDKIDLTAKVMTLKDGAPTELPLSDVFAGKKVVLFTLPGALTPTCTDNQAPEFVAAYDDFKAKGYGVACMTVNDPFVGAAFNKKIEGEGKIAMLCDGDAAVTKSLGIELETGGFGGTRAIRGSYVVEDGVFKQVNLEEGGAFNGPGSAKTVLGQL